MTAETGLVCATVFGGPKSKLRSCASPFHSGQAWIYQNPAKDSRKLVDFDVRTWRPGLRELYERAMSADAAAETVLASHGGGGNWGGALEIAEGALDALAEADAEGCARITLHFFWQWLNFLGLGPELDRCSQCGKPVPAAGMLRHSPREGGLVCDACRAGEREAGLLDAGPGCRRWLETVRALPPEQLNRYTLDKKSLGEARALVTALLAEALGKRPASWDAL